MKLLCRQPPCRLAPAPNHPVSSPGVEPGLRPSRGRVLIRHTPRNVFLFAPRRGIEPGHHAQRGRGSFEDCHAIRHTRRASCRKCLDQELNLDLDFRRVLCDPLHHRDLQRPDLESNQGQGLRRSPVRSATPSGQTNQSRRLDLHQHHAVYRTAASLFGHVGFSRHEREESNPVRQGWNLPALPGARSCIGPRPCDRGPRTHHAPRDVAASRGA